MLDIENYEQWAEVCDDDELIKMMYDNGVRPGMDEFEKLLGRPYNGPHDSFGASIILVGGLAITCLSFYGLVRLVKLGKEKMFKVFNDEIQEIKKEEES